VLFCKASRVVGLFQEKTSVIGGNVIVLFVKGATRNKQSYLSRLCGLGSKVTRP